MDDTILHDSGDAVFGEDIGKAFIADLRKELEEVDDQKQRKIDGVARA